MANLIDQIKTIQRAVGAQADGVFGPVTAARVLMELASRGESYGALEESEALGKDLDARTMGHISTLDEKARGRFMSFTRRAKATAATLGCDYVMIEGHRTWEEQDALFAQGRTIKGTRVTNAKGGQSNHNFGIAADFGVFSGKVYLDDADPARAAKVHKACSEHAAACGLEWGGSWKSFKDAPHYEVATGLSMMQKRNVYKARGSVL
jgi:peptidoglycan L-alanyl-D-glutamate endopeptidase CwlK